jgi:hypothetical protein
LQINDMNGFRVSRLEAIDIELGHQNGRSKSLRMAALSTRSL